MSAMTVRVLSAASYFQTQSLARGLARFLLVLCVIFIFFAATFPFDFSLPAQSSWDWNWNPHDPNHTDRTQNILFFIPLGFAVAAMFFNPRRNRAAFQIVTALIIGFVLTCTIESLQQYVSFRDPSLADIWCNTLGSVIGAGVYVFVGNRAMQTAARALIRLRPLATRP